MGKFKIGDEVWKLNSDSIEKYTITMVAQSTEGFFYTYMRESLSNLNSYSWIPEGKVFSTKEELIKSL
jgi:hypothetical protein